MFNNLLNKKTSKELQNEPISSTSFEQKNIQSSNMIKVINNLQQEITQYKKEIKGNFYKIKEKH